MSSKGSIRIFNGAVAIVTGGASGIGRALAGELAKRGAEVVLADRQGAQAEEAAAAIASAGGRASAAAADVTDFAAMERLVTGTAERAGRLDYMFNNAGVGLAGPAAGHSIADWDRIIDINIRGVVHGTHAASAAMLRQGFGHIINTSSLAGLVPTPGVTAYCATKHAVVGLSKCLRAELAPAGVRVSVLCPGFVRTPIMDNTRKEGGMQIDVSQASEDRIWKLTRAMPPDVFASKVLGAVARNRPIIVVPGWWKVFWLFHRFAPSFGLVTAEKAYAYIQEEMEKEAKRARPEAE